MHPEWPDIQRTERFSSNCQHVPDPTQSVHIARLGPDGQHRQVLQGERTFRVYQNIHDVRTRVREANLERL